MRVGLLASTGKHLDSFFPDIVKGLEEQNVTIFAASGSATSKVVAESIAGMTQSPGWSNLRAARALRQWVARRDLDVVVTNTATASAVVRLARVGVPVVYFCHGLHWNTGRLPKERVWEFLERSLLRFTDGIITINSDDHRWFDKHAPALPLLRLESGVGVPGVYLRDQVHQIPEHPLRILWIGDFSSRKRPLLAVELANQLTAAGVDYRLTMLGDGPLQDEVRREVAKLGLDDSVELAGRVESSLGWLDQSHVLVHTSLWEGLPRVLLESAARHRLAIAFDVKGVRDVPGVRLVTDGDVVGLRNALAECREGLGRCFDVAKSPTVAESHAVGHSLAEFLLGTYGISTTTIRAKEGFHV